jgi:hypothetical protein
MNTLAQSHAHEYWMRIFKMKGNTCVGWKFTSSSPLGLCSTTLYPEDSGDIRTNASALCYRLNGTYVPYFPSLFYFWGAF